MLLCEYEDIYKMYVKAKYSDPKVFLTSALDLATFRGFLAPCCPRRMRCVVWHSLHGGLSASLFAYPTPRRTHLSWATEPIREMSPPCPVACGMFHMMPPSPQDRHRTSPESKGRPPRPPKSGPWCLYLSQTARCLQSDVDRCLQSYVVPDFGQVQVAEWNECLEAKIPTQFAYLEALLKVELHRTPRS